MFENVDGRTDDGRTTDGRTPDAGVTGILIAHLGAFGSGELKIVKDFIIINQVAVEKTLMKNVHMCYMREQEGKIENLKKEGKMRISILIFIYTVHFAYSSTTTFK